MTVTPLIDQPGNQGKVMTPQVCAQVQDSPPLHRGLEPGRTTRVN